MNPSAIDTWLREHAGLDADSLGPGVVTRAVLARIEELGCEGPEAYLHRLKNSALERQELIDRVIVAETWFFRDRAAIDAVTRHAVETWNPKHPNAVFRVLCVPCSTGEEPYSLSMAFAQAGWPAERLRIEAIDIGRDNIARAVGGIYRKNSFRGADLLYRDVFLEPAKAPETWRVNDRVRASVSFSQGNLLAPDFAVGRSPYDAIFCRNLLIYFDRPIQNRAIATLGSLLAPDGLFAVGPAEPVLLFEHGYSAVKIPGAFLLQRASPRLPTTPPLPAQIRPKPVPALPPVKIKSLPAPSKNVPIPTIAKPVDTLEAIQALADAGQLKEADERGTALLARNSTPGLLYLLAVIADATGNAGRAEAFYRKTLYLDPQHPAALAQLALHAEKHGDLRQAEALRNRLRRVETVR